MFASASFTCFFQFLFANVGLCFFHLFILLFICTWLPLLLSPVSPVSFSFYLHMFASASLTCFTCFLQFLSANVCLSASFTCFPSTINCFLLTSLCIVMCALLNPSVSSSSSLHHLYSVASGGHFTNLGIIRKYSTIISHWKGVGWLESARPNENKPNWERQPLIAVKRDNIKHIISHLSHSAFRASQAFTCN